MGMGYNRDCVDELAHEKISKTRSWVEGNGRQEPSETMERGTLWLFNTAMENGPFIDSLPINSMVIFHGYVTNNQVLGPHQRTDALG